MTVVIVAAAVPWPRGVGRLRAQDRAVRVPRRPPSILTVPWYRLVTGPSLIFMAPLNVGAVAAVERGAGQARRDALDVEQHGVGVVDRRGHGELVAELHAVRARRAPHGGRPRASSMVS